MSNENKIIIVEDDRRMAQAIERHLARDGYQISQADSAEALWRLWRHEGADLILLDLNLGGEDGLDLARELVATTSVGVVIVTGRDDLQNRIDGFEAGADDYIIKPFAPPELRARVRAVLRRRAFALDPQSPLRLGPYQLDPTTMVLSQDGDTAAPCVRFTATETRLMTMLMRQYGRAVSRVAMRQREELGPDDRSVDVHIGHIRRKLREAGMDCLVIWPVRGHGYRLRLEATAE